MVECCTAGATRWYIKEPLPESGLESHRTKKKRKRQLTSSSGSPMSMVWSSSLKKKCEIADHSQWKSRQSDIE